MTLAPVPAVTLTQAASFPEGYSLENLAVRSDGSVYDQIAAGLTGPLKAAPGFRSHAAYPAGGGLVITEVWDSAEDHRAFVNSAVKPGRPDGVPVTIEVTELRNAFTA